MTLLSPSENTFKEGPSWYGIVLSVLGLGTNKRKHVEEGGVTLVERCTCYVERTDVAEWGR